MTHVIVVDLGYGDAGKGTVVDWLCANGPVHAVVRFNGGAQAAHNVVTPDGRHHTFAQLGSGSFVPGVRTHLSRFMLVDPLALAAEAAHLATVGVRDALDRLTVDRDALLTTPYHVAAGRARELSRGADRHGTCAMGVGEAMAYALTSTADAPRVADCASPRLLTAKLTALRDHYADELGALAGPPVDECVRAYRAFAERVELVDGWFLRSLLHAGDIVFEGAQGVLLDEWHGFHPYTTWSTTTFANAETLLAEAGLAGEAVRLGVVRTYTTRHGPGPMVTEDPVLTTDLVDQYNPANRWQGTFRVGHFDAVAHRYARDVAGGIDSLAVTHLDVAGRRRDLRICTAYAADGGERLSEIQSGPVGDLLAQEALTRKLLRARPIYNGSAPGVDMTLADVTVGWIDLIGSILQAPVVIASHGRSRTDKSAVHAGRAVSSPATDLTLASQHVVPASWSRPAGECPLR